MDEICRRLSVFILEVINDEGLYMITGCDQVYKKAFLKMLCREFLRIAPGKVVKYYYSGSEEPYLMDNPGIMTQELTGLPIRTGHIMLETEWADEDYGLSAVIIDNCSSLYWAEDFRRIVDEEKRVAFVLTRLKSLSEMMHIPVIAICESNALCKKWPDKRDILHVDYIEMLANKLIYLYHSENDEMKSIIEVRVEDLFRDMIKDYQFCWMPETREFIDLIC